MGLFRYKNGTDFKFSILRQLNFQKKHSIIFTRLLKRKTEIENHSLNTFNRKS